MAFKEQILSLIIDQPQCLMLLNKLSSGRAFTRIELTKASNLQEVEAKELINHIFQLGILSTRRNRKRIYYFIPNEEVQHYIQNTVRNNGIKDDIKPPVGMKYCRHCYSHLAGFVGVTLANRLTEKGFLIQKDKDLTYEVTSKGWKWFETIGIQESNFLERKQQFTKQCLDFSERKSHLGGKLGDALLSQLLEKKWVCQVPNSREIRVTTLGKKMFKKELNMALSSI